MTEHKVPTGHLVPRDGDLGEVGEIPTPEDFAAMARDGRRGAAVSDMPYADEEHHAHAREATGWDEQLDEQ